MTHITLFQEDWVQMKLDEPGRQKLKTEYLVEGEAYCAINQYPPPHPTMWWLVDIINN